MGDRRQSTQLESAETGLAPAGGVYLHVPFCRTICPYCDFAVVQDRDRGAHQAYVDALVGAIDREPTELRLRTVYLGGGTPGRLTPERIARLMEAVRRRFPGTPEEVTLEANPEDVSASRLEAWRRAGIGRLSVGVQRLDDSGLRRLGRARSAPAVAALPELLARWRELGGRASIDLIYGVPGEEVGVFGGQVATVLDWAVDHLSAYALTVEAATPYALAVARGSLVPPDAEVVADCYGRLLDELERRGWWAYEVSNFCRPGHQAVHNTAYWQGRPYLGFGMSAASMLRTSGRRLRFRRPETWSGFLAEPSARVGRECLSPAEEVAEQVLHGLRSDVGVPGSLLEPWRSGPDGVRVRRLLEEGWIELRDGRVRMPPRRRLLADEVAAIWLAGMPRAPDRND